MSDATEGEARWLIDGNNVMGSRPDGWWNDRPSAMARLAQEIAGWAVGHADEVVLVFDGREQPSVSILAGGNLSIRFAPRRGRNAADDALVELASDPTTSVATATTLVTADRGLIARLPADVEVIGPGRFLRLIGARRR